MVAVKPAGVLSTDEPGGMPQLLRQEEGCLSFTPEGFLVSNALLVRLLGEEL